MAGDLLPFFEISTKVGFYPDGHRMEPERIKDTVQTIPEELGRVPDTVLLHNPERSDHGFEEACQALSELRDAGYCRAWGFSTWNSRKLAGHAWEIPRPDVVMVRAGLTVPTSELDGAERLTRQVDARALWGMAPFGGDAGNSLWARVDTTLFLSPGQRASGIQATVAVALAVPPVTRLAVGTASPAHLEEIVRAESLTVSAGTVDRYRTLLRSRDERTGTA